MTVFGSMATRSEASFATTPVPSPRHSGDTGAALIEGVLAFPLVFLLFFAILDGGLLMKDRVAVTSMVRVGGREASAASNDANADWRILHAIRTDGTAADMGKIERIIIWKATGPGDKAPAACLSNPQNIGTTMAPQAGSCNVYFPSSFAYDEDEFACVGSGLYPAPDQYYCPQYRRPYETPPGPDYVGVYIRYRHDAITSIFGRTMIITEQQVYRIEPQRDET